MKFIFVRHGQSESNLNRTVSTPATKLTSEGIKQAKRTGKELKSHNVTVLACSKYLRAQQTAEVIAGELGLDLPHIKVIEDLGERFLGDAEGKPNIWDKEWFFTADNELNIEPRQVLLDRMVSVLAQIKAIVPAEGVVAVVGHGISGFYLRQAAAGKRKVAELDVHEQIENAAFKEVEIVEYSPMTVS